MSEWGYLRGVLGDEAASPQASDMYGRIVVVAATLDSDLSALKGTILGVIKARFSKTTKGGSRRRFISMPDYSSRAQPSGYQ